MRPSQVAANGCACKAQWFNYNNPWRWNANAYSYCDSPYNNGVLW